MLRVEAAGYRYPSSPEPALRGVDLEVQPGELVLLTGPTGCGKSTLLRLAAGLLRRHGSGEIRGQVWVDGDDPAALAPARRVRALGFVSQNPRRQVITATVGDEVAFALESAGDSDVDTVARSALERAGLPLDLRRPVSALSGGQLQRLMVAAALVAGGGLLLLDEPLAQLDPAGAQALMEQLRSLADGGVSVLLVEHRLEASLPWCDRLIVMERGEIVWRGAAASPELGLLRRLGLEPPGLLDLDDRLAARGLHRDTARWQQGSEQARPPGDLLLRAAGLDWTWPDGTRALTGAGLELRRGERVAVVGANGSGKSTLLGCLTGALKGAAVERRGRVVDVPQDPDLALFCETVAEELDHGPSEQRRPRAERRSRVEAAAAALSITDLLGRAPQALSRGQRLRVAVAAARTCAPDVLVLDEPTSGQDRDQVERMMCALADADHALLFATHDLDLALRHATRLIVLDGGRIVYDGSPRGIDELPPALPLPPLTRWCLDRGVRPATPARLAEEAR